MSKGKSGLCRWRFLLLLFVFLFISSVGLLLLPQSVEAAPQLSNLSFTPGSPSPAFHPTRTSYTVTLESNVAQISVRLVSGTGCTSVVRSPAVGYNSGGFYSGTAFVPLIIGDNLITITVTETSTKMTKDYTVIVKNPPPPNADLSYLGVSLGSLSPAFNANITDYIVTLDSNVVNIEVTAQADTGKIIKINGQGSSNNLTVNVLLIAGNNSIPIEVTESSSGLQKTYTIIVKTPYPNADKIERAQALSKKIAAGPEHSLALKADGTVVAWGNNFDNQCDVPVGLNNVVAVDGGWNQSLALKADGSIVSWGIHEETQNRNDIIAIASGAWLSLLLKANGEVEMYGGGWQIEPEDTVPVSAQSGVVAISASVKNYLALKADGTVVTWGEGSFAPPEGLNNVVAISAGSSHSLALKADGTVVAWGNNNMGQLNIPSGLSNIVAIHCDWNYSMVLKADGRVISWGQTYDIPIEALSGVVAISGGWYHQLALKADGTVIAWGSNNDKACDVPEGLNLSGRLGTLAVNSGILSPAFNPDILDYTAKVGDVSRIYLTVALENSAHELKIYRPTGGYSHYSNLGGTLLPEMDFSENENIITLEVLSEGLIRTYTIRIEKTASSAIPAQQIGKLIAGGAFNSAAVTVDGKAVVWGYTESGKVNPPAGLSDVKEIDLSFHHGVALQEDGTVVGWGGNTNANPPVGLKANKIVAGESFFLAINTDGEVVVWGSTTSGQRNIPEGLNNVVDISAGVDHILALKADGSVVAWGGGNNYGELDVPWNIQYRVKAIAAGGYHSLALLDDGTVVAWGLNNYKQCDVLAGLNNVIAIAAGGVSDGGGHSLALKGDGTMVAWGCNGNYQCSVPKGLSNVVQIAAGGYHSLALKDDGTVVAWGLSGNLQTSVPAGLNLAGGLSGLNIGNRALSPVFNKDTLNYTVQATWDMIVNTNVTASLEAPRKQALFINGVNQASGVVKTVSLSPNNNIITIEAKVPFTGLVRTYAITIEPPISNVKMTDIENSSSIKSIVGANLFSKLNFELLFPANRLSVGLDLLEGFEIVDIDGLYKNGVRVLIADDKFVIAGDQITINNSLQAGTYELRFALRANTIKIPITIKSFTEQAGKVAAPTGEPLKIEYIDLPNVL